MVSDEVLGQTALTYLAANLRELFFPLGFLLSTISLLGVRYYI